MPMRRCSGLSTRKSPPKLQNACPPRDCSPSWSTSTWLPSVGELRGGDETGKAGPHDDDVRFHPCPSSQATSPCRCLASVTLPTGCLGREAGTARTSGASSAAYGMKVLRLWRIRLGQRDTSPAAAVADAGFMTTETRAPVMLDEQLACSSSPSGSSSSAPRWTTRSRTGSPPAPPAVRPRPASRHQPLHQQSGGSVTAGLAIYDTMRVIPNDVSTLAVGFAASMGQFLLGAGMPGKRFACRTRGS